MLCPWRSDEAKPNMPVLETGAGKTRTGASPLRPRLGRRVLDDVTRLNSSARKSPTRRPPGRSMTLVTHAPRTQTLNREFLNHPLMPRWVRSDPYCYAALRRARVLTHYVAWPIEHVEAARHLIAPRRRRGGRVSRSTIGAGHEILRQLGSTCPRPSRWPTPKGSAGQDVAVWSSDQASFRTIRSCRV
jgi:hypothetical protein